MKLNSSSFVLLAVLGAVLATNSFAAGVFGYDCSRTVQIVSDGGNGYENAQFFTCSIGQFDSRDEAVQTYNYDDDNVFDSWSGNPGFARAFNNKLLGIVDSCDAERDYRCGNITIKFDTDIDLGGYTVSGSDTTCVNEFEPIQFLAESRSYDIIVDGYSSTVKGFCHIKSGNGSMASFFQGFYYDGNNKVPASLHYTDIRNLHFENAYVKATGRNSVAGVVAAVATVVTVQNTSVIRSKVIAGGYAGGIVGVDSVPSSFSADSAFLAKELQVNVELDAGVMGGIAGKVTYGAEGANFFSESNLVSVRSKESSSASVIGGLVGETRMFQLENTLNSSMDNVTLDFELLSPVDSVLRIGGAFGAVYGVSHLNVQNGTFDAQVSSVGAGNRHFGGVVGFAKNSNFISDDNNVKASFSNRGSGNTGVEMGGLLGWGNEVPIVSTADTLTLSMETSGTGGFYAGGLVGYDRAEDGANDPEAGLIVHSACVKAPEGKNLVTVYSDEVRKLYVGGLAGYTYMSKRKSEIRRSYVEGNIDASATTPDTSAVGGLAGKMESYNTFIYDNKTVGNILANADTIGFVVGKLAADMTNTTPIEVYANIHYGVEDVPVESALGSFELIGQPVADWNEGRNNRDVYEYNISYNYRNAIESGASTLLPTGKLDLAGSGTVVKEVPDGAGGTTVETAMNGVLDDSTMSSRLLTYVLSKKSADLYDGQTHDVLDSSNKGIASLACWENESGEVPHVCGAGESQTVYQVKIDLSSIQSKLHDSDFVQLNAYLDSVPAVNQNPTPETFNYRLIAYTENDGRLSDDFVQRVKSRSVDFGILDYSSAIDLDVMTFASDNTYSTEENITFTVVYEIEGDNNGYESLDDPARGAVYLLPKVTEFSRFGSHAVVPPVRMTSESLMDEYYVETAYLSCPEGKDCPEQTIETEVSGRLLLFSDIANAFSSAISEFGTELHLVYASRDEQVPRITVDNGSSSAGFMLYEYGNIEGQFGVFDSAYVSTASGLPMPLLSSAYSAAVVDPGFELNGWKVDFWAYVQGSSSEIETCYTPDMALPMCSSVNTFEVSENYFAKPSDIYSSMENIARSSAFVKWSLDVASDDMFYIDSIASAIAMAENKAMSFQYLLYVTPDVSAIPYTINFDVNTDFPVFIVGGSDTLAIYSRESGQTAAFPRLFSPDACFNGWSSAADGGIYGDSLNTVFLNEFSLMDGSFNLFGQWEKPGNEEEDKCRLEAPATLTLHVEGEEGADFGDVYLWQQLINPNGDTVVFRHVFENGELNVPYVEEFFRLHVGSTPKPGYALDGLTLSWEDWEDGTSGSTEIDMSEPMFELNPVSMQRVALLASFVEVIYVKFVLNKDADEVFYDLDFTLGDSLEARNSGAQVALPAYVYTVDACMAGWAYTADADSADVWTMTYGNRLYDALYETRKLYAVWRDAQECIESMRYVPVTAEVENGSIEIVETTFDGEKRVHKFGSDGRLILPPAEGRGEIRVYAVPDRGYMLDSLVMVEDGKSGTISDGTLISFGQEGVELYAYFSESTEPVDADGPVLVQSGNAVQFSFPGAHFVRNDDAWVNVVLENDDGDTLKDTSFTCNRYGCYIWWNKYPLKAGSYLFAAQMFDGIDTTRFERNFDVASEIAAGKSWHLVALSNVDMDDMEWKGKEKIYWWNESVNYGKFWQYQEFTKKSSAQQGVGYWYNSLDGKSLKLNEDAFVDEMEWSLDSVNTGWNLVANPYGWYIDLGVEYVDSAAVLKWAEEEKENDKNVDLEWLESEVEMMLAPPAVEFWRWDETKGAYEPADTLRPYEAVWAKVNDVEQNHWELSNTPVYVDTVKLDDETLPQNQQGRNLFKAVEKSSKGSSWALQVMLSDANGKMDSWNMLGAGLRAWNSEEPPAGMGDHVNLSIVEGGKRLAKSVKAAGEGDAYEWNVELSATSGRKGYLEIAGVDALLGRGLHVFVTVDGKTQEIHSGEKLAVGLSSTAKSASILVAPTARRAVASELRGLRAVQSGSALQVSFDASGMDGAKARVDVFDMKGSVVASTSLRAADGTNVLSLEMPRRGLYTVRVAVAGSVATRRILLR